jgi:outer membrane lipoprotein LolB
MKKLLARALVLVQMLMIAACSLPVTQPDEQRARLLGWDQRQSYLDAVHAWMVDGRIAMQTEDDAWSASLKWRENASDYGLVLYGPLGRKELSVIGGPNHVTLTTNEGDAFTDSSASSLIFHQTGWHVPVENLRYWARALAAPGQVDGRRYDSLGRLSELSQSGWVVYYQDYQIVGRLEMPRKIRLVHKQITVKMILRDWQLQSEEDATINDES